MDTPDAIRVEITGDGGEILLKRKGEALDALQQIVNTGFRRELDDDRSFVVDCMGYRKGKDDELRQMARFTMERAQAVRPRRRWARSTPTRAASCTSPSRRIRRMSSESIGDAFLKTVIISKK